MVYLIDSTRREERGITLNVQRRISIKKTSIKQTEKIQTLILTQAG